MKFLGHRGDRLGLDSTRNDQVEEAKISVYVESDSVRANSARDVHAESGNLRLCHCIVGELLSLRLSRTDGASVPTCSEVVPTLSEVVEGRESSPVHTPVKP